MVKRALLNVALFAAMPLPALLSAQLPTVPVNNAEMTALFNTDQADRTGSTINWKDILPRDQARLARTEELLEKGLLITGDDYYHAAYLFQHGDNAESYLKAHILAMIAMKKGYTKAAWIASATLDRYLLNIGKAQVFGTQFKGATIPLGEPVTVQEMELKIWEPFDKSVVTDDMRSALNVPRLKK